jgi:hypothetical protein
VQPQQEDPRDILYKELECVFHQFPMYHIKILLRDFKAKVEREKIFSNQQIRMRITRKELRKVLQRI